jgi:hypothetical protein
MEPSCLQRVVKKRKTKREHREVSLRPPYSQNRRSGVLCRCPGASLSHSSQITRHLCPIHDWVRCVNSWFNSARLFHSHFFRIAKNALSSPYPACLSPFLQGKAYCGFPTLAYSPMAATVVSCPFSNRKKRLLFASLSPNRKTHPTFTFGDCRRIIKTTRYPVCKTLQAPFRSVFTLHAV